MKAKKYRLETVLGVRRRANDDAAQQVALCLQQLRSAEEELVRRQAKLQDCCKQQSKAQTLMNEELNKGIQAQNVLAHQNYLNDLRKLVIKLKNELEAQIKTVTKAEKELETAREKLAESARDLKSIEVHKENWQVSEQKEENKREQKIGDEIGAILHGRRESS